MADEADTLDIAVRLALEEADRQYDALKKKIETPLRIPIMEGGGAPGTPVTGRTFSGASVVTGPTNTSPNAPTGVLYTGGGLQQLIINRAIGGSGFGPAVGPLPNATMNTFYGDATRAMGGGGSNPTFGAWTNTALALSQRGNDAGGGYAPRYTGGGAYRQSRPFGGDDDFEGEVVGSTARSTPLLMGPSAPAVGRRRGVGDRSSRDTRETMQAGAAAYATVSLVNEVGTYFQKAGDRNRYDSLASAADSAYSDVRDQPFLSRTLAGGGLGGYSLAALAGPVGIGAYAIARRAGVFTDPDDARDTSLQANANVRNNQVLADARATNAGTAMVGSSGYGLAIQQANEGLRSSLEGLGQEAIHNGFLSLGPAINAAQARRNALVSDARGLALQDARANVGAATVNNLTAANDVYGAGVQSILNAAAQRRDQLDRDTRGLDVGAATALRAGEAVRTGSELAAFYQQYRRQAQSESMSLNGQTAGSALSRSGFGLAGQIAVIRGNTAAALNLAPTGNNAEDVAGRQAIANSGLEQIGAATQAFGSTVIASTANVRAAALRRSFNPFGAREAEIVGQFQSSTRGVAIGSPDFIIAATQASSALADNLTSRRVAVGDADRSVALQARILDRVQARNSIGASATALAGQGIDAATDLDRQGPAFAGAAQGTRNNTIRQLGLQARDFALDFRGVQLNPNLAIDQRRSVQDPSEVFASIRSEQTRVALAGVASAAGAGINAGISGAVGAGTTGSNGSVDYKTVAKANADAIGDVLKAYFKD